MSQSTAKVYSSRFQQVRMGSVAAPEVVPAINTYVSPIVGSMSITKGEDRRVCHSFDAQSCITGFGINESVARLIVLPSHAGLQGIANVRFAPEHEPDSEFLKQCDKFDS